MKLAKNYWFWEYRRDDITYMGQVAGDSILRDSRFNSIARWRREVTLSCHMTIFGHIHNSWVTRIFTFSNMKYKNLVLRRRLEAHFVLTWEANHCYKVTLISENARTAIRNIPRTPYLLFVFKPGDDRIGYLDSGVRPPAPWQLLVLVSH